MMLESFPSNIIRWGAVVSYKYFLSQWDNNCFSIMYNSFTWHSWKHWSVILFLKNLRTNIGKLNYLYIDEDLHSHWVGIHVVAKQNLIYKRYQNPFLTRTIDLILDFSCGPGEYLDKDDSQQCQKCPVGTFSLGGGELFQDWTTLPEGFLLVEETAEPDYGMMDNDERPCNQWVLLLHSLYWNYYFKGSGHYW